MSNGSNLHPYASRYTYVGAPIEAEGIFEGKQTSPWFTVDRPSDWYRGPWQIDRTQGQAFRRQPRPLSIPDRGAGYTVPAGTSVGGCGVCGLGAAGDSSGGLALPLIVGILAIAYAVMG